MSDEVMKVDAIVVGAGPAGTAAALLLARAGWEVLVFERGEFPGSKNLFGGILYTNELAKLIPDYEGQAPLERHVSKRRLSMLSKTSELAFEFFCDEFNTTPYNHSWTALRPRFDCWFAEQAEEAGAMMMTSTVVDELWIENGRVVGVKARREEGDVRADVVVVAEGCNSFLAQKAGFRPPFDPRHMQVAALEFVSLPPEVIEDRFALEGDEGLAIEYLGGEASQGMFGAGLIYTNKDCLSVGVSVAVHDLPRNKLRINDVLEHFKAHPAVKKLIRGGKTTEYSGHMIPEFGTQGMDSPVQEGCVFVGDTYGLVNLSPFYHEGTNLAMGSGRIAAETLLDLKKEGQDFTKTNLQEYVRRLNASTILADVRKHEWVPSLADTAPEMFDAWPQLFGELGRDWFTMNEQPKAEIQKAVRKRLLKEVGLLRGLRVALKARRLITYPAAGAIARGRRTTADGHR